MIDDQGRVQRHGFEHSGGVLGLYRKFSDAPLSGPAEARVTTESDFILNPTQSGDGLPLFLGRRDTDLGIGLLQGVPGSQLAEEGSGGIQFIDEFVAHRGLQPFYAFLAFLSNGTDMALVLDGTIAASAINVDGEIAFRATTGALAPGTGIPEACVVLAPEPGGALQGLAALAALATLGSTHHRRHNLRLRTSDQGRGFDAR